MAEENNFEGMATKQRENTNNNNQCIHPYFSVRDELATQDDVIFNCQRVIIPESYTKRSKRSCMLRTWGYRVASGEQEKQSIGQG